MQILYFDDQIVLLREETSQPTGQNHHLLIPRPAFNSSVEADRFTLIPESDLDLISAEAVADWTEVPQVGQTTADNLHEAGYNTVADVAAASRDELTDVAGVGTVAAQNLIDYA